MLSMIYYVIRRFILLAIMFLPKKLKPYFYRYLFGWNVDKSAKIGLSFIDACEVDISEGAVIKNLTIIDGLSNLYVKKKSRVGNLNWISGSWSARRKYEHALNSKLIVGEHSAITNRHYIDCSDTVAIGMYSTIAGVKSTILTHSINVYNNRQETSSVNIGDYCFLGSDLTILSGANVSSYNVIGAKSLIPKINTEPSSLYGGVPLRKIKCISIDEVMYFSRQTGFVN